MNTAAPKDVMSLVAEMTNRTPEQIRSASASERAQLIDKVVGDPDFPGRFRAHNISTREHLASSIEGSIRKGWFDEYVKGEGGWLSFGTVGKVLTMKPVEGVVNAATFNKMPILGKIARWAAVAAAAYFGLKWLAGSEMQAANAVGNQVINAGQNLAPTPAISNPTNAAAIVGEGGAPNVIPYGSAPVGVPAPHSNPIIPPVGSILSDM